MDIGEIFKDEKRNLTIIDKKISKTNTKSSNEYVYKYKCNICGFECGEHYKKGEYRKELWVSRITILKCGCSCCSNHSIVTDINSAFKIAPWLIDLGVDEGCTKRFSVCGGGAKVEAICPNCNEKKYIKISNVYNRKSIGCKCSDGQSYISKYILSILKQLNIKFESEVRYNWNQYLNPKNNKISQASIDFVIHYDDREIPLEVDGEFHRKDNKMNKQTKEHSELIDRQRDDNCLKHLGEETIRISNDGDIKENIIKSKLNTLFDLSKIDWLKAEEFALKNIVKEVCDKYNKGCSIRQLCEEFNMSDTTIRNYLKKGNNMGWCSYIGVTKGRKISVWKENECLGIFNTVNSFVINSIEIVGFHIEGKNIYRRINKNNKLYKKPYKKIYYFKEEE